MSHMTKILLKTIHERIKNKVDKEVREEQFGFRRNMGTREAKCKKIEKVINPTQVQRDV
jgi:hypothetical protein